MNFRKTLAAAAFAVVPVTASANCGIESEGEVNVISNFFEGSKCTVASVSAQIA